MHDIAHAPDLRTAPVLLNCPRANLTIREPFEARLTCSLTDYGDGVATLYRTELIGRLARSDETLTDDM